jgi:hypothetical protein
MDGCLTTTALSAYTFDFSGVCGSQKKKKGWSFPDADCRRKSLDVEESLHMQCLTSNAQHPSQRIVRAFATYCILDTQLPALMGIVKGTGVKLFVAPDFRRVQSVVELLAMGQRGDLR